MGAGALGMVLAEDDTEVDHAKANADYGYIGAGIVGVFVVVVGCWYMARRVIAVL